MVIWEKSIASTLTNVWYLIVRTLLANIARYVKYTCPCRDKKSSNHIFNWIELLNFVVLVLNLILIISVECLRDIHHYWNPFTKMLWTQPQLSIVIIIYFMFIYRIDILSETFHKWRLFSIQRRVKQRRNEVARYMKISFLLFFFLIFWFILIEFKADTVFYKNCEEQI